MNTKPASISASEHSQRGSSLIEILVSVLVLSIGLLGVATLQAVGVKNNTNAYLRTQSNVFASDILDRMRVNRTVALAGSYAVAVGASSIASGNVIANSDISSWKSSMGSALPAGDGSVDSCPGGVCTVTVQWRDGDDEGGFATSTVTVVTRL